MENHPCWQRIFVVYEFLRLFYVFLGDCHLETTLSNDYLVTTNCTDWPMTADDR